MLRRLSILVTLLLVITVVVTGCGRYTVAVEESEIPYSEPPVDTRSPELTVEPPVADEKTESDGELIPFAQNLDLIWYTGIWTKRVMWSSSLSMAVLSPS